MELPPQGLYLPPKVLYFDIERSLMKFYGYEREVRGGWISKEMICEEAFIICWSACWVGQDRIVSACVTQDEALQKNDKRVLEKLWSLLDAADFVTGHNVDGFDWKKVNNRFLIHGLGMPIAGKSIDTLKLARKHFPFDSNALDYISVKLGGKPKKDIDRDDWIRIVETGDEATLRKANRYCRGDVREGVGIFNKFIAHIESGGRSVYR